MIVFAFCMGVLIGVLATIASILLLVNWFEGS